VKIWIGHGSEHSANLVMIGRFSSAGEAEAVKRVLDQLVDAVNDEIEDGTIEIGEPADRYSDAMRALLQAVSIYDVGPAELEQFGYDVSVSVDGRDLVLRTDETNVLAYLKVLLDKGARVEVFSAHRHPYPAGDGSGGPATTQDS